MFKHELNKWSLRGNRKYSFSTACKHEAKYLYEVFKNRKQFKMEQKQYIVCESICPLSQNWNETQKHFFVIKAENYDFIIEGYDFKEKNSCLATIYNHIMSYMMLNYHREIFSIRVCNETELKETPQGFELYEKWGEL